jgi:hypothetical protein
MSGIARRSPVKRAALWFGLLGGAVAWTLHLVFAYVIAEFGCVGRTTHQEYLGVTQVAWLELALTAGTTLAAAAATAVAFHHNRLLRSRERTEDTNVAAERNTAWVGVLTSGTFTFIIVFESIPILFFLHGC